METNVESIMMHYYTHHIGDYKRDTSHLTLTEHGIYRQLLDLYYLTENPLDANAMRLIGARTEDEKNLVTTILNEFFDSTSNGYIHKRCEVEINRIYEKSEKARASAKARWNKEENANAMRTQCEDDANGMLPINPIPINPVKDIIAKQVANIPHKEIIELYAKHLPMLSQVKFWTDKRKSLLKARWHEEVKRQDIAWWDKFFSYIATSDFLTGKESKWQADIEWILNASNIVKILEGKYENKAVA